MMKTVTVNGAAVKVLNTYSVGPGSEAHTIDIPGGYLYRIAGEWRLQRPGQFPVVVEVTK